MIEQKESSVGNGWVIDSAIGPKTTLHQGDLIKFSEEKDPVKEVGIVVTADCDLEKKKHSRILTLVPVLSVKATLEYCLLPEELDSKKDRIEDFLFNNFSIDSGLDRYAKLALLQSASLEGKFNPDSLEFIAINFLQGKSNHVSISSYKALMSAIGMTPKGVGALKDKINNRGDLFVLPSASVFNLGNCVAWIRHIWQVPTDQVAIKTSEIKGRTGERIARLDSPYRYRLTQLMAQVFSDIGLPETTNFIDQLVQESYSNG